MIRNFIASLFVVAMFVVGASALTVRDHVRSDAVFRNSRTTSVPEGGSSAIYLLGTATVCMGAMIIRGRRTA